MKLVLLDWWIVAGYMLVVLALGYWGMRRVKDAGGYLLANRRLGKWLMVAQTFSGGINSTDPMSTASSAYKGGFSGIWLALAYIFVTPFFWMWPPVIRRMRIVTVIDLYRLRFGRAYEVLNIVLTVITGPISIGAGVKAAAMMVIVMAGTDGAGHDVIGPHTAIAMIVIPTLVYTLLGGVHAVAATDLFQGVLIIILSFIALPFMVWKVGSVSEVTAKVNATMPNAWDLVSPQGYSGPALTWYIIGVLFAAPMVYGWSSGAARNEMAARWQILGNLGKRFCTVGWALAGVFAIALYGAADVYAKTGTHAVDRVFATASIDSLPAGLRGVMVAAMLAAVMSTIAGSFLGFGATVVNNVYKNFVTKTASARHYLVVARIATASPVALAWWVAASEVPLRDLFSMVQQIGGLSGVAVLGAVMWRRVTGYGALAATLVMSPLFWFATRPVGTWPGWYRAVAEWAAAANRSLGIDPGLQVSALSPGAAAPSHLVNPIYILSGVAVLVVVSLVTPQHSRRPVEEFYARLDTPVGDEEKLRAAGFQADSLEDLDNREITAESKDRDTSRRLLLLDFFTWPLLLARGRAKVSDYWVDLAGIAGSVVFVVGFMWGVQQVANAFR